MSISNAPNSITRKQLRPRYEGNSSHRTCVKTFFLPIYGSGSRKTRACVFLASAVYSPCDGPSSVLPDVKYERYMGLIFDLPYIIKLYSLLSTFSLGTLPLTWAHSFTCNCETKRTVSLDAFIRLADMTHTYA